MEPDIGQAFLTQLVSSPEGRQHMLSISVEAEEGDEGDIFGQLADCVDDARLRQIVERHRDDEVRHAQLFRDCLARQGLEQQPVPDEMKIIRQIADTTGGFGQGVRTREQAALAYALLLVIEERGVEQFPRIAAAFRPVDPETADVYLRVARDERGHVRYCQTIGRYLAGDDITWDEAVEASRVLEADAFASVGIANLSYCGERGWVDVDALLASAAV